MNVSKKVLNSLLNLHKDEENSYVVASSSMSPVLNPGDRIEITPVNHEDIKIGQVIVFRNKDEKLIVHRVVKKKGLEFITAGDNLRIMDPPVKATDIVGIVKGVEISHPPTKLYRIFRAIKRRIKSICKHC
jgi:signal peptidase I